MTLTSSHYLSGIKSLGLDDSALEAGIAGQDGVFCIDAGGRARGYVANSVWDADVLNRKTWTVQSLFWDRDAEAVSQLQSIAKHLYKHAKDNHVRFMTVRFGADQLDAVQVFEAAGWRLVDTLVVFQSQNTSGTGEVTHDVRDINRNDATEVCNIVSDSFSQGRIQADIHFEEEIKSTFYARMAQSMLDKIVNADDLLARGVVGDEGLLGFYLSEKDTLVSSVLGRRYGYLSLIATHPKWRHQGIGRKLLTDFLDKSRDLFDVTEISTQLSNSPALALYANMGIPMCGGIYSMHLHLD
ncbi:GNAT family N-acetyltransferase [Pseudomonadota bacterium]